jgi:rhodanese-related sulfurtransferase
MTTPIIALLIAGIALALALLALLRASGARQEVKAEANDLRRRLANQDQQWQQAQMFQARSLTRLASGKPMTPEMILEQRLWEDLAGDEAAQRVVSGTIPLDVRSQSEVRSGMIPGALHIPLDALESRISELPRDQPLLVYCAAGVRSAEACEFLCQEGFEEVANLAAGFPSWPQSSQSPSTP